MPPFESLRVTLFLNSLFIREPLYVRNPPMHKVTDRPPFLKICFV